MFLRLRFVHEEIFFSVQLPFADLLSQRVPDFNFQIPCRVAESLLTYALSAGNNSKITNHQSQFKSTEKSEVQGCQVVTVCPEGGCQRWCL